MGEWKWVKGKIKVEPDAELELLSDSFNKYKKRKKSNKPKMK